MGDTNLRVGFVLRGGGTCGHTLPELSNAQIMATRRTAHPPNHPHAPTCAHAARSAATFIALRYCLRWARVWRSS
jgi:hypothetical protein